VSVEECVSESSNALAFVITGIGDAYNSLAMSYPNPVTDVLYVDLSSFADSNVRISIYDSFGHQVENILAQRSVEVRTEQYSPGMYLLVVNQQGKMHSSKFVKK
jgi:hypothetical protein